MKINRLAVIALAGVAIQASAVNVGAYDWRAEKTRALAYYDAYGKHFANTPENEKAQEKIKDVLSMTANIEGRETMNKARIKALLVLREPDEQRRAERASASETFSDLRLYYLYGNMIPRILNEFDDGLVEQGMNPRPFPIRPLAITEDQFKAEQAKLIAQIGLSRDEIDPKPGQ